MKIPRPTGSIWQEGPVWPPTSNILALTSCPRDRKSTRLNSSHGYISYAVFCLKKKKEPPPPAESGIPRAPTDPDVVLHRHAVSRPVVRVRLARVRACAAHRERRIRVCLQIAHD